MDDHLLAIKMAQTTRIPTLLLIISLIMHSVKSGSRVIVRPTDSNSSTCGDHVPCDTLSNFIANNKTIFSDESTLNFEFLPGIHEVKVNITQLNIMNKIGGLNWYGNKTRDTLISCQSPLVFVFSNTQYLQIKHLQFSACGHKVNVSMSFHQCNKITNSFVQKVSSTLILINPCSFQMQGILISQSRGYGLVGLNAKGNSTISSCYFIDNNPNCFAAECMGGGAAFYFEDKFPRNKREKISPNFYLWIINSAFHNGTDLSDNVRTFSCKDFANIFSEPAFKANGLVIIAVQQSYGVVIEVTNTVFTQNTRNPIHPAVWIHDYGGVKNNNRFRFVECKFEMEGTVRVSSWEMKECLGKKGLACHDPRYPKFNEGCPDPLIEFDKCSFNNSSHTALEICAKLMEDTSRNERQQVLITKSIFHNYHTGKERKESNKSVVSVEYLFILSVPYKFVITITVAQNQFISNDIQALLYSQVLRDTEDETEKYPVVFSLNSNYFSHNTNLRRAIVRIKRPLISPPWNNDRFTDDHDQCMSISGCIFKNNTSENSKAILQIENICLNLINSTFELSTGTSLHASQSLIYMEGFNSFTENNGTLGGAINLNLSRIVATTDSHTEITNNSALYGGGIYAMAARLTIQEKKESHDINRCTIFQDKVANRIKLDGNKAKKLGNSIFGGTYKNCRSDCMTNNCNPFFETLARLGGNWIRSEIVCPPIKLCTCDNGVSDCNKTSITLRAFPGEVFIVQIAAMSELNRVMKAVVVGTMCQRHSESNYICEKDYKDDIGYGQRMQELNQQCTNLTYTVDGRSKVSIELTIDYDETSKMYRGAELFRMKDLKLKDEDKVIVQVDLLDCPVGFELRDSNKNSEPSVCDCLRYFLNHSISCNAKNGTVVKPKNKWIFSDRGSNRDIIPALVNRTAVHDNCPYDYCIHEERSVNLSKPDEQCNFERSGVLCGACPANLSVVLGTSNCKKCSNIYLLLIIPFALAGVALVVLLLKCNLTVSVGHINGIIFYASILQINKALLFTNQKRADDIFSTFIAWLNLDLGIETCFFENMDSSSKVWLQFIFPVYLWILIALIILLANYSSRMGRLIGSNSVPVLATLFLLSYAKLLRTIIAAVSFTFIVFEDGSDITVWLRDGNIEYFNTKYAVLFFVALIFTFLYILPLTLLVLLAPCLQAKSHHKAFRWVNRLKPFLDAYQGPYSKDFRYWTGLLLVLRIVLFVIDAANYENDPSMSFYWTISLIRPIAMICLLKKNVYRHKFANYIETVSLLNIVVLYSVNWLTMTTTYKKWYPIKVYTTYFSVTLMMVAFIGAVSCNAFTKLALKLKAPEGITQALCNQDSRARATKTPATYSAVDLQEPLMDAE